MVLEKIFAPRWKHKNPQVRKRALLTLDPHKEESQKIYMEVLLKDPELYIRRIAIKALNNVSQLQDLRESTSDNEIYQEATSRLCELLASCNKHRPIGYLKNVLSGISENRILEYVAAHANDEELQLLAMDKVANESILFEILQSTKYENNKKHALAKLQTANSLKRAIKILKRKDKQLESQAQDMLDKLQEKSKQTAELQKEYRRTINEFLELFNLCKFSSEWKKYETRLRELNDRCHGLFVRAGDAGADSNAAILREVEEAFKHVEQQLTEITKEKTQRPDWENGAAIDEHQSRPAEFDQLIKNCEELKEIISSLSSQESLNYNSAEESCQNVLLRLKRDWKETLSTIDADNLWEDYKIELENLKTRFVDDEKKLIVRLDQIREAASYISTVDQINARAKVLVENEDLLDLAQVNKVLKSYQANTRPENAYIPEETDIYTGKMIEALSQKRKKIELQLEKLVDEFSNLTAKLEQALAEGKAKGVNQLLNRGRNILKLLPRKYLSQLEKNDLPATFNQLNRRADSLLGWRQWSTSTVKEKLIEEMEKLAIETNKHIADDNYDFSGAAAEISQARASWKQASKGAMDKEVTLWEKFDAACNKAYEPCQLYFNKLDEFRDKNLRQREQVCEDLKKYFDTVTEQQPDEINWKALEKIIRVAREDWEKLGEVSRSDRSAVYKRFHGILHKLEKLARDRRDENKAAKQVLINRIEATLKQLEEQTIALDEAVATVKRSQNQWKETGPASKDQQLWKKFKKACDSVFVAKKAQHEKIKLEEASVNKQRDEIVNRIDDCSEQQGAAIFQARSEVEKLQSEWRDLPKLYKGHKQERRFNDACENFSKKLKQHQADQLGEIKRQVQSNVACCYQLENLIYNVLEGKIEPGLLTDSVINICEKWNTVNEKTLSYTGAVEERFQQLKDCIADIVDGQGERLKRMLAEQHEKCLTKKEKLCIQLEILANKESPEQSKQQRMEIQVARLADNMKQSGKPDLVRETQQLLSQWHTSGFILPPESQQFERRFYSALELLDKDYQYPL